MREADYWRERVVPLVMVLRCSRILLTIELFIVRLVGLSWNFATFYRFRILVGSGLHWELSRDLWQLSVGWVFAFVALRKVLFVRMHHRVMRLVVSFPKARVDVLDLSWHSCAFNLGLGWGLSLEIVETELLVLPLDDLLDVMKHIVPSMLNVQTLSPRRLSSEGVKNTHIHKFKF